MAVCTNIFLKYALIFLNTTGMVGSLYRAYSLLSGGSILRYYNIKTGAFRQKDKCYFYHITLDKYA